MQLGFHVAPELPRSGVGRGDAAGVPAVIETCASLRAVGRAPAGVVLGGRRELARDRVRAHPGALRARAADVPGPRAERQAKLFGTIPSPAVPDARRDASLSFGAHHR